MKKLIFVVLVANIFLFAGGVGTETNPLYTIKEITLSDGTKLMKMNIIGSPVPPANITRPFANQYHNTVANSEGIERSSEGAIAATLDGVPHSKWAFGCSPTSAAMLAGYYDRHGYPNIYAGPANGGVMPLNNDSVWPTWTDGSGAIQHQNPLSATHNGLDGRTTRGHVDDYWIQYDDNNPDPYVTNGWVEHTAGDCTADFMKTNRHASGNIDGGTAFYSWTSNSRMTAEDMENNNYDDKDGAYGLKLFVESRGYTVDELYTQKVDSNVSGGFSFANYKSEIDMGRPVLIHLAGHTIVGIGYDISGGVNNVTLYDTWDHSMHTMVWGTSYAGKKQQMVTVIHLSNGGGGSGGGCAYNPHTNSIDFMMILMMLFVAMYPVVRRES